MPTWAWLAGASAVFGAVALVGHEKFKTDARTRIIVRETKVGEGFEPVAKAFQANFEEGREAGAQLVCYVQGKKVIDLSGGADEQKQLLPESLVVIFSCTKVIESLVIAMLQDRNKLQYDDSISKYWPSLQTTTATIADLMKHQSGLSSLRVPPTREEGLEILSDPDKTCAFLEVNQSEWSVDEKPRRQLYHALTRGMYASEIVRRVDGRTMSQFVREEIVAGDPEIEFHIGCPEELQHRVAEHYMVQSKIFVVLRVLAYSLIPAWLLAHVYEPLDQLQPFELEIVRSFIRKRENLRAMTLLGGSVPSTTAMANDRDIRALPLSSATGISNARSLARLLSNLVMGDYLSAEGMEAATKVDDVNQPAIKDELLCRTLKISDCGFGLDRFEHFETHSVNGAPTQIWGAPNWYGWAGAGGSVLVFNPELKASFAYTVNGFDAQQFKARGVRLLTAFHKSLVQYSNEKKMKNL